MTARDDVYAVMCARATDHDGAIRLIDALVAEVRREDAARLLDERRHHASREIFCEGLEHAAELLALWADGTDTEASR
jgi:hypothetical protein